MPDASPSISTRFQARDEPGCQPPDPTEQAVGTPFPPDSSSTKRCQNRCEQPYPGRWCEINHRERVPFRTLNGFHSEPFLRTDASFPWIPPEGPTLGIHHAPEDVASNAKLPSWRCTNASSTPTEDSPQPPHSTATPTAVFRAGTKSTSLRSSFTHTPSSSGARPPAEQE